ncbi:uncharacterized protein [Euwallacea similis]|uniref:uncharacterized protein n=1 Tax=Euwallacea similis TaxID=1736056 RepID=UPI00344DDB65
MFTNSCPSSPSRKSSNTPFPRPPSPEFTNSHPSSLPNSNTPFPHPYNPPFPSRTFLTPFLVPSLLIPIPLPHSFSIPFIIPPSFQKPSIPLPLSYPSSLLKYSPSSLHSLSFKAPLFPSLSIPLPSSLIKAPIPPPS